MNFPLFQELVELNLAFEQVLRHLQRMEKMRLFHSDTIRSARADVETARVDANREFFDNFDDIVENDAVWAYKFQREYNRKIKDPDDIYLELKDSEERRKRKGLPPRLVVLPGWDMSDEERYDEEQARKRKRAGNKRKKTAKKRDPNHSKPSRRATGHANQRHTDAGKGGRPMTKRKAPETQGARLPSPRSRYPGVRGKVVDWVEHVFAEGMLYVRVRFTDKTELCWVLQTAHVILEADLSDWKTGDCKQLKLFVENESDWGT